MFFNTLGLFGFILLSAIFIWLLFLTYFVYRIRSHYNSLTRGELGISLSQAIEKIFKEVGAVRKEVSDLQKENAYLKKRAKRFIQKIRLKRYNPFKDVGGDQSFILGLMDEEGSGVVISSLHSRENTRWYAKEIVKGEGKDYKLSKEEKDAIFKK